MRPVAGIIYRDVERSKNYDVDEIVERFVADVGLKV